MADGQITFTQSFVPSLKAGQYQVSVEQKLNTTPQSTSDAIDESYINTAGFAVAGERFRLQPDEVDSAFPPANNQGEYSNVLPHIVLRRRTLLWERTPTGAADNYPWLALLLFTANDPPPPLLTVKMGDLQRRTLPSQLPADAVSYEDGFGAQGLTFGPDYGESFSDTVQAIDIDVALFSAIAPSLADLGWLGSGRTVSTSRKAGGSEEAPETYSLLIGNRMPEANTKCTAHLVSLEGMSGYLPSGPNYEPASFKLPDGSPARQIRLVSLFSWSFTSLDPAESFDGLLTNLKVSALQRKADPHPAPGSPEAVVAAAFNLGYTAVNHLTREGDTTVSWYRGPFVPFPVPPSLFIPAPDPDTGLPASIIQTADELVRYDPGNGLMDISYAAAWELGRLLGLANKSFSVALTNWRRAGQRAAAMTVMHEAAREKLGGVLALPPPGTRNAGELHRMAAEFIVTHLKPIFLGEESR